MGGTTLHLAKLLVFVQNSTHSSVHFPPQWDRAAFPRFGQVLPLAPAAGRFWTVWGPVESQRGAPSYGPFLWACPMGPSFSLGKRLKCKHAVCTLDSCGGKFFVCIHLSQWTSSVLYFHHRLECCVFHWLGLIFKMFFVWLFQSITEQKRWDYYSFHVKKWAVIDKKNVPPK